MHAATLETNLGGLAAELFAPKSTVRRLIAWKAYVLMSTCHSSALLASSLQGAAGLELLCWPCMCAQLQHLGQLALQQREARLQEGGAILRDAKRRLLSSAVTPYCNAMLPPPADASHGVPATLAACFAALVWPAGGCRSGC